MAEEMFKKIVFGALAIMPFVFLMLGFTFMFALENNKDIGDFGEEYNYVALNESLGNLQEQAEDFRQIFSQEDDNNFVSNFLVGAGAFFGIAFSMFGFIIDATDIVLIKSLDLIFANPLISGVIIAMIIILALFGIYRLLKIGD